MKYDRGQLKQKKARETFITDRQYNLNRNKGNVVPQQNKKQLLRIPNGCIVCKKQSCWSKNHPKHEIDEVYRKLKNNAPVYDKVFQIYVLERKEKEFCSEVSSNTNLDDESTEKLENEQCDLYKGTNTN